MKYSANTLLKAALAAVVTLIGTATAAANGGDVATLDLGQWIESFGTALVSAAALLHRPDYKPGTPNDTAAATVTDVVTKAAEAHEQLVQQAVDSIQKVQAATGELTKLLPAPATQLATQAVNQAEAWARPVLGPLASQVVAGLPRI